MNMYKNNICTVFALALIVNFTSLSSVTIAADAPATPPEHAAHQSSQSTNTPSEHADHQSQKEAGDCKKMMMDGAGMMMNMDKMTSGEHMMMQGMDMMKKDGQMTDGEKMMMVGQSKMMEGKKMMMDGHMMMQKGQKMDMDAGKK